MEGAVSRGYCGQCGQPDAGVHTCSPQSSARAAPKVYAVCQSCGVDTQWGRVHTCSPQVALRLVLPDPPSANAWTEAEDAILRAHYPHMPTREVVKLLPGRTMRHVYHRAERLGVRKTADHLSGARGRFTWTPEERQRLRDAYESAGDGNVGLAALAASLGRLTSNVSREARRLGLTRRGRPQPQATRQRAVQAARERYYATPVEKRPSMRGKKMSEEGKARVRERNRRLVREGRHPWQQPRTTEQRMTLSKAMTARLTSGANVYSRCRHGRRADLDNRFFRSSWEANYARFLNWQKERGAIASWEYEAETFWFENIRRGVRCYTPDFTVTEATGATYLVEVKGWMDAKSKTKLKRMAKYHPGVDLRVVDAKAYREIAKKLGPLIPNWE